MGSCGCSTSCRSRRGDGAADRARIRDAIGHHAGGICGASSICDASSSICEASSNILCGGSASDNCFICDANSILCNGSANDNCCICDASRSALCNGITSTICYLITAVGVNPFRLL